MDIQWQDPPRKRKSGPKLRPVQHGTYASYAGRGCRCDECGAAHKERMKQKLADRLSRPEDIPHGTASGYANWMCRCAACRTAFYTPERAARQKANDQRWRAKKRTASTPTTD